MVQYDTVHYSLRSTRFARLASLDSLRSTRFARLRTYVRTYARTDGRMDGRTDGRTDGQTDVHKGNAVTTELFATPVPNPKVLLNGV